MISILILLVAITTLLSRRRRFGHRECSLPLGPPTRFLFGNAKEFPRNLPFLQFTQWAAEYGDMYSLKLMNRTMVVLSSGPAVKEVLDLQGALTGNRPQPYLVSQVEGVYPLFSNSDDHVFKGSRKAYHAFLSGEAIASYLPMQQAAFTRLLQDIAHCPENLFGHIQRMSASTVISLLYGKSLSAFGDNKPELYFEGAKKFIKLGDPFTYPALDIMPLLRYVPARWAPWKSSCEEVKVLRGRFFDDVTEDFEQRWHSGERTGSFLEKVLDHPSNFDLTQDEIRGLSRTLADGGIETTTSYLENFILALACNPSCQTKAQLEIDRVIGDERLPTLDDFKNMPYIQALVKEVHRFRPGLPGAVPHVAAKDIHYRGYIIPKGTILIMNTWGIFHDPEVFDNPEVFDPERYLRSEFGVKEGASSDGLRSTLPFGAGRRLCPANEMAQRSIAINTMNFLWSFQFTDLTGKCSMDLNNYHCGIELSPNPFPCDIQVRGAKRAKLIEDANLYYATL